MKHKMFLFVVAMVLLITSAFNIKAQVGFNELDPNILWVADSTIGRIDGFAVHPNGNIFAYQGYIISEINGADGKLIRKFNIPNKSISSFDISGDGKYLASAYDGVIITDLNTGISKTVGIGNLVTFAPNSHKIAYRAMGQSPEQWGHDSSIVILDLNTDERQKIKTEEMIQKIAFSPDGRFFATGGSGQDDNNKFYTTLKLWDAKTLKLIKVLARFDDENYQIPKIQFSTNGNKVAYFGDFGLIIFETGNFSILKNYNKITTGYDISRFAFIGEEHLGLQSEKTSIIRMNDDEKIDLIEFPQRGFLMETNTENNILFAGTGYPVLGGSIIAWDLNKVFSNVEDQPMIKSILTEYQKGILKISNLETVYQTLSIKIHNIKGELVKQITIQNNGSEINIPVKLQNGIYLLQIQEGKKVNSSKFLVTN